MSLFFNVMNFSIWSYCTFYLSKTIFQKKIYKDFAQEGLLLNPNYTTEFQDVLDELFFYPNCNSLQFLDAFLYFPLINILYIFACLFNYLQNYPMVHYTLPQKGFFSPMSDEEKEIFVKNPNGKTIATLVMERTKKSGLFDEDEEKEVLKEEKIKEERIEKEEILEISKEEKEEEKGFQKVLKRGSFPKKH